MNFELTDEQQQLADAVRKMLAGSYGFEQRQAVLRSEPGFSAEAWATFAEMGLTAIALPEADGGFGGGAMDLMATMEACGEALVVEPLLDTIARHDSLVNYIDVPLQHSSARLLRRMKRGGSCGVWGRSTGSPLKNTSWMKRAE